MPRIRVLLAKTGLDPHYRGVIIVARFLRDRGMEVVYIGNQSAEAIVEAALHEDVDVVGLSSLSGNHMLMVPRVMRGLAESGARPFVVVGGVIPAADESRLLAVGVAGVFGTGSNLEDIAKFIEAGAQARRGGM